MNEEKIIEIVEELGFKVIIPSSLTLADEVRLFQDARLIVGPLGAGLYNIFFTKPGSTMLVLGDPNYAMDWPAQACGLRGHSICYYFGSSFYSYETDHLGTHNNWILDPDRFRAAIEKILERQR